MNVEYLDLLLERFPPLRHQSTGAVYGEWRLMRDFCGSDEAVAAALRLVPPGLDAFSDFWTLLRLVHVHPPPAPLALAEARHALALQRPRGRAMVDPEFAPREFWDAVLGVRPRFAPRGEARRKAPDPRIAALAVRAHAGREGTTCVGLSGGQYLVAHTPERPAAPWPWARAWSALGLPPGLVKTITGLDSALSADGKVIRWLWLGVLDRRATDESRATQAELYLFHDWLSRHLAHAVAGEGPAGADPITQESLAGRRDVMPAGK